MIIIMLTCAPVQAFEWRSTTLASGNWAVDVEDARSQMLELALRPEVDLRFSNRSRLTAIARARVQTIDGLRPIDVDTDSYSPASRPALIGEDGELELRELYYERQWHGTHFTLGKQQVVWGKSDGLKVLDIVNPQSFRLFVLENFEDSRIPLWMFNVVRPMGDWDAQFIWIVDQTYHALPKFDATYALTSPRLVPSAPPGMKVEPSPVHRPNRVFQDSDAGVRLSGFWKGWDLSVNYLYQYQNLPVPYQFLESDGEGPYVRVSFEYERTHVMGASIGNAFGDWVVRGEFGYFSDRYFISTHPAHTHGIARSAEWAYVLGLDWSGLDDTFISAQIFQSGLLDAPRGVVRDELDTSLTFLVRRHFLNETLEAELLWIVGLNDDDGLVRSKVSYELADDLNIWLGADFFYGNRDGLYGQFTDNDRLIVGGELGF